MILTTIVIFFVLMNTSAILSQGFNADVSGEQRFSFKDDMGRNQATFYSEALLENITGLSTDVWGNVSFNNQDIKNTLGGEIFISTASLKSGIDERDEHLKSEEWLDAEEFPTITFAIDEVTNVSQIDDDKLRVSVMGDFTVHGITRPVYSDATLTYLKESEETKVRMPGDLLGVKATFRIKLSDYGIRHMLIGTRVSEEIEINANIVGTNAN
jgi:polyisoprenoid-binding protein YceI